MKCHTLHSVSVLLGIVTSGPLMAQTSTKNLDKIGTAQPSMTRTISPSQLTQSPSVGHNQNPARGSLLRNQPLIQSQLLSNAVRGQNPTGGGTKKPSGNGGQGISSSATGALKPLVTGRGNSSGGGGIGSMTLKPNFQPPDNGRGKFGNLGVNVVDPMVLGKVKQSKTGRGNLVDPNLASRITPLFPSTSNGSVGRANGPIPMPTIPTKPKSTDKTGDIAKLASLRMDVLKKSLESSRKTNSDSKTTPATLTLGDLNKALSQLKKPARSLRPVTDPTGNKPPEFERIVRNDRDGAAQAIMAGFDDDGLLYIDFDEDGVIDLVLGGPGVTLDAMFDEDGNLWIDTDGDGVGDFGFSEDAPHDILFPPPAPPEVAPGPADAWDIVDAVLSHVLPFVWAVDGIGYYGPDYFAPGFFMPPTLVPGFVGPVAPTYVVPVATTMVSSIGGTAVAGDSDRGMARHVLRYLSVRNNTGEDLTIHVQIRTLNDRNEWVWSPENPDKSDKSLNYDLIAGQEAVLQTEAGPLAASRIRIWAESSTRRFEKFRTENLWLVPEKDTAGEHQYFADSMQTYRFTFE